MDLLTEGGMVFTEMGIQTGSPRIQEMYHRVGTNEQVLKAVELIDEYTGRLMKPHYHIILDNPWETTVDTVESLKLLLRVRRPFMLCPSSLVFYPGTALYYRAKEERLITDEVNQIYRAPFFRPHETYLNLLILLTDFSLVPRWFIRILAARPLVSLLHRDSLKPLYRLSFKMLAFLRLVGKGLKALFRCDFGRIARYFHRAR